MGALLGLPLVILLAGFFVVPPMARTQLVKLLEEETGGEVKVGKIRFNPLTLRADLTSFSLTEPGAEKPVIAFGSLLVDARWTGFLTSDGALDALVLVEPQIQVEIDEEGELNLAHLFAGSDDAGETPSDEEADATPLRIDVDALRIEGGRVLVRDLRKSPVFEVAIAPVDLEMEDLSTAPNRSSRYSLTCSIDDDATIAWTGSLEVEPLSSEGELRLEGFDLHRVAAYVQENLNFELMEGAFAAKGTYTLETGDDFRLALQGAEISINGLSLRDPERDQEFFRLDGLEVGPLQAEVGAGGLVRLEVNEVRGAGGRVQTARSKDGVVRMVELLTPREATAEGGGAPSEGESAGSADGAAAGEAPEMIVGAVRLSNFALEFEDQVPATPAKVSLADLEANIRGYSTVSGEPLVIDLKTQVGSGGRLAVSGPLQPDPLSGQLKVEAQGITLTEWSPYLEGLAQLEIPDGRLGSTLDLKLEDRAGELAVSVKGRAQIDDLKTLDRTNARRFVDWGSLRLEGLDYSPEAFVLGEVVLSQAMGRMVIDAKGRSNLDAIFSPPAETAGAGNGQESKTAGAAKEDASPLAIRVDRVTLDNVGFAFADLAPTPNFTMDLSALSGTIEGLSSETGKKAKVKLDGRIDDTAPVRISGDIHPIGGDAYTDVKVIVSGVSMPTFSPYAARFAGYGIERGKLDLNLAYKLNNKKLRAENRIDLHEFRFGKSVKSADATTLPLPLVAEILRSPKGDIRLDIPLRGNLDDPSFNLFELLSKTFVNIITRIATSPFSIVGGLIPGGGDKISKVEFDGGSAELSPAELEELAMLSKVLIDKKSLRLEIRGKADPAADEAGLRASLGSRDEMTDADWRSLARARAKAIHDAILTNSEIDPERLFMVDVAVGAFAGESGRVASQLGLRAR